MTWDPAATERLKRRIANSFGTHFLVFVAVAFGCVALAAMMDWRWLYWVPAAWSIPLVVHYLIYKASTVGQSWVDERTEELRLKSYDRSQIESIRSEQSREDRAGGGGRDRHLS